MKKGVIRRGDQTAQGCTVDKITAPPSLCRVCSVRPGAVEISPLNGTILGTEGSRLTEAWIERDRVCRASDHKYAPQSYSLPAWSQRWDVALRQAVGGEA